MDKFRAQKAKEQATKKEFDATIQGEIADKVAKLRTDPQLFQYISEEHKNQFSYHKEDLEKENKDVCFERLKIGGEN